MFSYTVKVYPIPNPKSKIRAYASLLIDNVFEVTGFKIFDGVNGLFVKPPQHKGKNKTTGEEEWFDDARFVGESAKEVREEVYSTIVSSYNSNVRTSSQTTSANLQTEINNSSQESKNQRPLW